MGAGFGDFTFLKHVDFVGVHYGGETMKEKTWLMVASKIIPTQSFQYRLRYEKSKRIRPV